jgi:hypothetical protein
VTELRAENGQPPERCSACCTSGSHAAGESSVGELVKIAAAQKKAACLANKFAAPITQFRATPRAVCREIRIREFGRLPSVSVLIGICILAHQLLKLYIPREVTVWQFNSGLRKSLVVVLRQWRRRTAAPAPPKRMRVSRRASAPGERIRSCALNAAASCTFNRNKTATLLVASIPLRAGVQELIWPFTAFKVAIHPNQKRD